jgi:hypothetical protein
LEVPSVRAHWGLGLLGLLAALGASACASESVDENDERVEERVSALSTFSYTDGSGLVRIRVTQCDWSSFAQAPSVTCAVDPAYALVGGGAEVEGSAPGGGLLTESRPDRTNQRWVARSKDHGVAHVHRIRAYAVGMQLVGVSLSSLRQQIRVTAETSGGPVAGPGILMTVPEGEILLGGGARTIYSGAGQLLWASAPVGGDSQYWLAQAHDHQFSDPGWVMGYLVSIPRCPAGFGRCLVGSLASANGPTGGGYQPSGIAIQSPWAVTSVGAIANTSSGNNNRLLTDAFPHMAGTGGVSAWSKDHIVPVTGFTTAHARMIRAQ